MNRKFCDKCGAGPIDEDLMFAASLELHTETWVGTKTMRGSINPTDGTWTPTYYVRCVFDVENKSQRSSMLFTPDLCAGCMIVLLEHLKAKLRKSNPA